MPAKWIVVTETLYLLLLVAVCLRIIYDTRSVSKTLAYLLFVVFVPVVGMVFYFSFGINYRKRKLYSKKLRTDDSFAKDIKQKIEAATRQVLLSENEAIISNKPLIQMLSNPDSGSFNPVFHNNEVELLVNGEAFFPLLKQKLREARKHIHIEFYIYEDDRIGNEIKDILIEKAKEGVEVRFIYDDFGSRSIRKTIAKELKANGVKVFPFNKIRLIALANRLNYRNHRKIVVIDGEIAFTGGINISDRYINSNTSDLYWRDTQVMIRGYAAYLFQHIFLSDWNFCSNENIAVSNRYFPELLFSDKDGASVQVASSGPDSENPLILYSVIQAIKLAQKEVLITTPYYIPDSSLQEALILAALSGVEVKLLVPDKSDSMLVTAASQAYFEELLKAGVRIFRYQKGFVHAKTFVTDRKLASVGTANLDLRSFDLNFEVSALIYDKQIAIQLAEIFDKDTEDALEIQKEEWINRPRYQKISERFVRLLSPFM